MATAGPGGNLFASGNSRGPTRGPAKMQGSRVKVRVNEVRAYPRPGRKENVNANNATISTHDATIATQQDSPNGADGSQPAYEPIEYKVKFDSIVLYVLTLSYILGA